MKVKATVCFSGKISMYKGEERNIPEGKTLTDLLKAGYVEEIGLKKTKSKSSENPTEDNDDTAGSETDEAH